MPTHTGAALVLTKASPLKTGMINHLPPLVQSLRQTITTSQDPIKLEADRELHSARELLQLKHEDNQRSANPLKGCVVLGRRQWVRRQQKRALEVLNLKWTSQEKPSGRQKNGTPKTSTPSSLAPYMMKGTWQMGWKVKDIEKERSSGLCRSAHRRILLRGDRSVYQIMRFEDVTGLTDEIRGFHPKNASDL